jgi:hypothetical protein
MFFKNINREVEKKMQKIFKEPLLHFFVIGACIFVLFSVVNKEEIVVDGKKIVVSAGDIERKLHEALTN